MGGMCRERLEVAINTRPMDLIMQLGRSESISPSGKLSGPLLLLSSSYVHTKTRSGAPRRICIV